MEIVAGNLQLRPSEAYAALGGELQCPLGLLICSSVGSGTKC